jgi:hypothetical protein
MAIDSKRNMAFPLRLTISLKAMANLLAQEDGVSLNHFINLAVAEKISRLESEALMEHNALIRQKKYGVTRGVVSKSLYSR